MNNLPQRKKLRLKGYNYSNSGYYFITICTKNRKKLLSKICVQKSNVGAGLRTRPTEIQPENINIINTEIGETIEKTIKHINKKYKYIDINNYIIMPDHIHMIIENTGRVRSPAPTKNCNGNKIIYK